MAHKRVFLGQCNFECIVIWRFAARARLWRAHSFFLPTPCRLRRPNHPNLFLLGFSSKLISCHFRQGRAGQAGCDFCHMPSLGLAWSPLGPSGGRTGGSFWGPGWPTTSGVWVRGPVLVTRRTCSGTGPIVGATVPMAVERRASVLGRSAPSRSRGLSAAHPRRWAA